MPYDLRSRGIKTKIIVFILRKGGLNLNIVHPRMLCAKLVEIDRLIWSRQCILIRYLFIISPLEKD